MTLKRLIVISTFAALIVISTFIQIPVPPVSFTLQTMMIILIGLLLKPVDAFLSVTVYLLIGFIGVPVFTSGGGMGAVFLPTGGFLLGFPWVALGISFFKSKTKFIPRDLLVIFIFGLGMVYLFGIIGFILATNQTMMQALILFIPYYGFDLIKIAIAYVVYLSIPKELIQRIRMN